MQWNKRSKNPPVGKRILIYSPCYNDDIGRYRIIDSQFLGICDDATHWCCLEPPTEDTEEGANLHSLTDAELAFEIIDGYFECDEPSAITDAWKSLKTAVLAQKASSTASTKLIAGLVSVVQQHGWNSEESLDYYYEHLREATE